MAIRRERSGIVTQRSGEPQAPIGAQASLLRDPHVEFGGAGNAYSVTAPRSGDDELRGNALPPGTHA
jgi:hypothetical protein